MQLVTVEVRPGVYVRITAEEAKRLGKTPGDPDTGTKRARPKAVKQTKKVADDGGTGDN